eukprot:TRINITY_DN70543_c0_g1_i1.p1 TRINITY_DN70543_c0_g1~~TRINITY_DN70543_c0_g1_i1.p1  ORF type:complete len:343 (-),score=47.48 TRINITY_DN70543_c0_g1_i1:48-971(-)
MAFSSVRAAGAQPYGAVVVAPQMQTLGAWPGATVQSSLPSAAPVQMPVTTYRPPMAPDRTPVPAPIWQQASFAAAPTQCPVSCVAAPTIQRPRSLVASTAVQPGTVLQDPWPSSIPSTDEQQQFFVRMIKGIHARGFFTGLRPDAAGVLHINVPFCGSCAEGPPIAKFAVEDLLPATPGAQSVCIHCQDVSTQGIDFYKSTVRDPRVQFDVQVADGSVQPQPPAALAIGLHPQPLPRRDDRLWDRIIENVVRSSPLCLFTCWMQAEAEELVGMLRTLGCNVNLERNPSPLPPEGYSMRFQWIVLAQR